MGWGIFFKTYLSKINENELEGRQEDLEEYLDTLKTKLTILISSQPCTVKYDDGNEMSWNEYLEFQIRDLWEELNETIGDLKMINECINNKDTIKKTEC